MWELRVGGHHVLPSPITLGKCHVLETSHTRRALIVIPMHGLGNRIVIYAFEMIEKNLGR